MKYLILFLSFFAVHTVFAVDISSDENVFNVSSTDTSNALSNTNLKAGNVDMDSIPLAITGMIQLILAIAGTLSIVALIYHAVQMQLSSGITGDSSGVDKAKKGMYGALIGFALTILSWFIVMRVVEILTSATST